MSSYSGSETASRDRRGTSQSLGSDAEYSRLELSLGYWEPAGRGVLFGTLALGLSPSGELPAFARFDLGGLGSLSGFAEHELLGSQDRGPGPLVRGPG